jgi:hypothetical protein
VKAAIAAARRIDRRLSTFLPGYARVGQTHVKLKPILLLAIAGGAAVALKKRAQAQDAQPDATPRYAPPAEAGAQPSAPPDEPQPRETPPAEDLQTKPHDLPEGVVMPDTSADDPTVQEAEDAAAADAAAIGEKVDETNP